MTTTTAEASSYAVPPFETYRDTMKKWVDRIVPRRARRGPFDSKEDLYAEADYALVEVWQREAGRKTFDELCRIGTCAVIRRMFDIWKKAGAGRSRGWEDPAGRLAVVGPPGRRRVARVLRPRTVSLDPAGAAGRPILDIPVPSMAEESLSLREAVERAAAKLDEGDREVLSGFFEAGRDCGRHSASRSRIREAVEREVGYKLFGGIPSGGAKTMVNEPSKPAAVPVTRKRRPRAPEQGGKLRALKRGVVYRVKEIVLANERATPGQILETLKSEGLKASESTVAGVRQDFLHSLRFLREG